MKNQTGQTQPPSPTISNEQLSSKKNWWWKIKTLVDNFLTMNKHEWLEDMRGNLSMVAALISTMTFQGALNPGGVVQTRTGSKDTPNGCNLSVGQSVDENITSTGETVLATVYSDDLLYFVRFNTFSFVASLSATLLLVSGISLRHRLPMWFLSIAMSASLTPLAVTYPFGVLMVNPDHISIEAKRSFRKFMWIWIGLLLLISAFITIRFLVWFVKKGIKLFRDPKNKSNIAANPENDVA